MNALRVEDTALGLVSHPAPCQATSRVLRCVLSNTFCSSQSDRESNYKLSPQKVKDNITFVTSLRNHKIIPAKIRKIMENIDSTCLLPEVMSKKYAVMRISTLKKLKINWINSEYKFVRSFSLLKDYLHEAFENIDRIIFILNKLKSMFVDALMLKRHPNIVLTISELRKYGNSLKFLEGSGEAYELNLRKIAKVQRTSNFIFNKYESLFCIPIGSTFLDVFAEEVQIYRELTGNLLFNTQFDFIELEIRRRSVL